MNYILRRTARHMPIRIGSRKERDAQRNIGSSSMRYIIALFNYRVFEVQSSRQGALMKYVTKRWQNHVCKEDSLHLWLKHVFIISTEWIQSARAAERF